MRRDKVRDLFLSLFGNAPEMEVLIVQKHSAREDNYQPAQECSELIEYRRTMHMLF